MTHRPARLRGSREYRRHIDCRDYTVCVLRGTETLSESETRSSCVARDAGTLLIRCPVDLMIDDEGVAAGGFLSRRARRDSSVTEKTGRRTAAFFRGVVVSELCFLSAEAHMHARAHPVYKRHTDEQASDAHGHKLLASGSDMYILYITIIYTHTRARAHTERETRSRTVFTSRALTAISRLSR